MRNQIFCIPIVLFFQLTFCHSQTLNYQCNFDENMTGDCQFKAESGFASLSLTPGAAPTAAVPLQPLSDVTSTQSLTKPDNELCKLPYNYTPGNWNMYFCRLNPNNTYTCPTDSGVGQCVAGKYGNAKITGGSKYNQTFLTTVKQSSSTVQCLDFYYYITNTSGNAKMQVGWKTDSDRKSIIEVTALADNKWQHSGKNFTAPTTSSYQLTFRMMRDTTSGNFFFALDEIKIYDHPCGFVPPTTIPIPPNLTTDTPRTTSIPTVLATTETVSTTSRPPLTTQTIQETSSSNIPTRTTTISTVNSTASPFVTSIPTTKTTIQPLTPIFRCDFSVNSCFDNTEFIITNGTDFTPDDINEPPRVPLSNVNSIIQPTNNNEACQIPYRLPLNNSTNATGSDMWFCYKNQCPTESGELSTCAPGNYGLISIDAWETNKTIISSISRELTARNSVGDYCLRYWYYFTVYDQLDWGQQVVVSITSDNQTNDQVEIDRLSVAEMAENRWYQRNVTYNITTTTNYTLMFHFEVTNINRTEDPALNRTIYFALDNIDLYDRNCRDLIVLPTTPIATTEASTIPRTTVTTTTNKNDEATAGPPGKPDNLSLPVGLSVGLGIPVLLIIMGVILFFLRRRKRSRYDLFNEKEDNIPMRRTDGRADSDTVKRHIF